MPSFERLNAYQPYALAALRIVTALLFIEHGTMKLFAFPIPQGAGGPLSPLFLFAALLEFIGGIAILVGFLTRPVAFILAGQMAVAYFMAHFPSGFFPAVNGGAEAILYCFVFLFLVFAGAGAFAIDKRNGGHHLMRLAGQTRQHCGGIRGVARLFQHVAVEHDDSIRAQHRQVLLRHGDASTRFVICQTAHIVFRRFIRTALLFNIGMETFKLQAKLRQQLTSTR